MIEQKLDNITSGQANLYVADSMAMFRQFGFWSDTKKVYQFVPCLQRGFVIVTRADVPLGVRPLYAWVVYRPTSLTLSWLSEKSVYFYGLDSSRAMELFKEHGDWFRIVGRQRDTTL